MNNILFTVVVGYCALLFLGGSLKISKNVFDLVENDKEFFETVSHVSKTQDIKLKLLTIFFAIIHINAYIQII